MPEASHDLTDALGRYPRRYCPVCSTLVRSEFLPGPGGRPGAACPKCRCLERDRFFAVLLDMLAPSLEAPDLLLEMAPSPKTSPLLARLGARTHLRLDLGADPRTVDVLGSLTALPLPDASVDLMVCYHVLEHVPDDGAAMREIARVLSPRGLGLLQVPFHPGRPTDEDPSAPEQERVRRFGQADHVRAYGDDFEDRLAGAGLGLGRVTPLSMLGAQMVTWMHLTADEVVWLVRPDRDAQVPPPLEPGPTALTRTFDAMLSEMTRLRARLVEQRQRARRTSRVGPDHG